MSYNVSNNFENDFVDMKLHRLPTDNFSHMEQQSRENQKIWANTGPQYGDTIPAGYVRNFNSEEEAQQLPPRIVSYPADSFEQRGVSQRIIQQRPFEVERTNIDRQTGKMPHFPNGDEDKTLLLVYTTSEGGSRLLRPQSFSEIPISSMDNEKNLSNKINNQVSHLSNRRSYEEPLERVLLIEDNQNLVDNSRALIQVPRPDGQISMRQQTPLNSDIHRSNFGYAQKNYPQQSDFSFLPRQPFFDPFLSPHSERFGNFPKYMPNRPPLPNRFPRFINNPFRQNCPPLGMNPCGCSPYMQPARFPAQDYYRFPAHQMKLSNPKQNFEWDLNNPDHGHYPWSQNGGPPPTFRPPKSPMEFSNYLRGHHQNDFGLDEPIYYREATKANSFQGIFTDPYRSHINNETDIDGIDEEQYFTYVEKTIPNFKILPKNSSLKMVSLMSEKEEKHRMNSTFASSNQIENNSGKSYGGAPPHQTAQSFMLMRLLKFFEENIDMSNYSMDFQGNYVDSHGRPVDPFHTYITDLEKSKLMSLRRDEASAKETLPSCPPVVVLRNHRSNVVTLDEGFTLKNTAKCIEKDEDNYERNANKNNAFFHDYHARPLGVPNQQKQAHQEHQQREERKQQHFLQPHPEIITEIRRREMIVREDFCEPSSSTIPGERDMFFKTSAEEPIDMMPPWEKERLAKEREFRRYNRYKSQCIPGDMIYSNVSQLPARSDVFDDETRKRNVTNISQQSRLVGDSEGSNKLSHQAMAESFQSPASGIDRCVNTKYAFLKDSNSEEIQGGLLNIPKYQSRFRSFDEIPFVTEATDESDPESEVVCEGELPGNRLHLLDRNSFLRLKKRFEPEKHVQFVDEGEDDPFKKYQNVFFRNPTGNYNYPY